MIRKAASTLILSLFVLAGTVTAQTNVAYMNTDEILSQLPEAQEIDSELNDLIEEKRGELEQRSTEFQQEVTQYQQEAENMSDEERSTREQELGEREQELQQYQQTIQQEIQQRRNELLAPVFQRMETAIEDVSEEMDIDLVLNEATGQGEAIVFYASDEGLNITDEVLSRMNTGGSN